MSDLIQALKKNKYPFGLMTEEMQAKAKEIGIRKLSLYTHNIDGEYEFLHWCAREKNNFDEDSVYQLPDHYTEKPKVVECEVSLDSNGFLIFTRELAQISLTEAIDYPDFIGFKYDDERLEQGVRVSHNGRAFLHESGFTGEDITFSRLDEYEVLTPTHVLFKGATE